MLLQAAAGGPALASTSNRGPVAVLANGRRVQQLAAHQRHGGARLQQQRRRQQRQQRRLGVTAAAAPDTAATADAAAGGFKPEKPTLFGVPVSNCAARNRFVIYKKGLESQVDIAAPRTLGEKGVKSPAYLALNPQGKMPLLVLPDGTPLPESQVVEQYLLDKYSGVGPSLVPPTPELRARAHLAARLVDLYITPIQGCMYKKMDAADRCEQLQSIDFQLDALERVLEQGGEDGGPFVAGADISFGDAALFPTFVFFTEILPKHFGWPSVFTDRPRLEAWWAAVQADPEAARVIAEMRAGLADWEATKRWDTLGISAQVADGSFNWSCA